MRYRITSGHPIRPYWIEDMLDDDSIVSHHATYEDAEKELLKLTTGGNKSHETRAAVSSVVEKYMDNICWGDRDNNLKWVEKMIDDIASTIHP